MEGCRDGTETAGDKTDQPAGRHLCPHQRLVQGKRGVCRRVPRPPNTRLTAGSESLRSFCCGLFRVLPCASRSSGRGAAGGGPVSFGDPATGACFIRICEPRMMIFTFVKAHKSADGDERNMWPRPTYALRKA